MSNTTVKATSDSKTTQTSVMKSERPEDTKSISDAGTLTRTNSGATATPAETKPAPTEETKKQVGKQPGGHYGENLELFPRCGKLL